MSEALDEEFFNIDQPEDSESDESDSHSETSSESDSENDPENELESDSESDSDSKQKDKKVKQKVKKQTKKLKKMIVDEKIPPLKKLIEIALKNDISITDVKGDPLNKNQLYDKLKFRYPELLQPKERKKIKTEYVKRILNVEDRQKEFEKLKAKTAKLTQKEEERVAFLLRVFEKIEEQKEADEKLKLRENFIKEEKKRYDDMFSLSLLDNDDIFDNAKNFPMIEVLVKKVKKNYLQKTLKKYVNSQNLHHYYSMLILYKVIRSMGSDKLIEPVTYEEIQNEVDRLHEIEKSFMTTKDLEKIKDILDGVVPKEDTVKKIELFKELKQVKKQINDWIIKLKTSDTDGGDDDDDDDGKHKDGDDSIEKIILKLKEKESGLIKQFKKFDKDFYLSIEKSIKDLESKLQEKPLSKEDEILFKNNLKELKQQEQILFSLTPFTFTRFSSVDEIEGRYIVLDPFIKDHKNFVMVKDEMLQKPRAYKEEDIKNIMRYLSQELDFTQSIYDHLSEIFIRIDTIDDEDLKKMFSHLRDEKINYDKTHPSIQRETVKYMAYRLLSKNEECKQLVSSLIKKQEEIQSISETILIKLKEKLMIVPFYIVTDKDKDNSPFLIRNALDILKKKLLFKDDMLRLIKEEKMEKGKDKSKDKSKEESEEKEEKETEKEEEFKNYLRQQVLGLPYETQEEMSKIDKLIETYKFVDIGEFKKYKKALKEETKRYASSISEEYKEFFKQFQEIDEKKNKKQKKEFIEKHKSLIEAHTNNEADFYKHIKAIEKDIIDQFDFTYAIEQLKLEKKSASFHFPQHTCPEKYFKKPWMKGYTGTFYVEFVDKIDIPDILIDGSDILEEDGKLFYRGTRYLDMLLCNRGKNDPDKTISLVKHKKDKYRIRIKYEVRKGKLIDDDTVYQQEQQWLKQNTENFNEQIVLFGKKTVKDVEKTLSQFLTNHLSSYFEKENAAELTNSLILKYTDKKVDELLDHLGRLVIFLEEKYMKNEAHMFNERLKAGYVRDVDVLRFSVTDILQDVYQKISIQKDKCAEKIIDDVRKGKTVDIDQKIKDTILQLDLFDDVYDYSVREIIDEFPQLCKDKYDIEKLNEKVEKSVAHYVKKTLFDLLTLTKLIKSGSIEPFRYTKAYKSLEKLDCYSNGSKDYFTDTVFYIENGIVYCFSLGKLLSEGIVVNEYTKNPFSAEFMLFLEKFSIPAKKEAEIDMEKDDVISDLLQCFYDNISEFDKQASSIDSEFKNMFPDPIFTKQSVDEEEKEDEKEDDEEDDEEAEKIAEIKTYTAQNYVKMQTEKLKFMDKIKQLKDKGFTPNHIFKSGVELKVLLDCGFKLEDIEKEEKEEKEEKKETDKKITEIKMLLHENYVKIKAEKLKFIEKINQLKHGGFTGKQLLKSGIDINMLIDAGFRMKDLE
jgi:hypothetical protein